MLAALVLTGVLRGIAGPAAGARIASAAIGLGFLLGYYLILGWPPLPPATSTHKLAFVAAAGVCAGLLIDVWAAPAIVISRRRRGRAGACRRLALLARPCRR